MQPTTLVGRCFTILERLEGPGSPTSVPCFAPPMGSGRLIADRARTWNESEGHFAAVI